MSLECSDSVFSFIDFTILFSMVIVGRGSCIHSLLFPANAPFIPNLGVRASLPAWVARDTLHWLAATPVRSKAIGFEAQ